MLELNEPPADANNEQDPVGRRIDDVLTTAQTFDVAGFGEVQPQPIAVAAAHPLYLPLTLIGPPLRVSPCKHTQRVLGSV